MAQGVLSALGGEPPKWDLIGPTAEDDIRRAIQRYGADAVKEAVKQATKAKRGRRRLPDFPELREVFRADAREWLAGRDPFTARSNYAIAKEFAERNPGHSMVSTHKRIERKLSKGPYDRRWFTLVTAENISRDEFSYTAHLRALDAVAELPDQTLKEFYRSCSDRARATVADFEAREGEAPAKSMTFRQVEMAVEQRGLAALISTSRSGGMFGLRGPSQNALGSILSAAVDQAKD